MGCGVRGKPDGAPQETEIWTCSLAMSPKTPREGSIAQPRGGHIPAPAGLGQMVSLPYLLALTRLLPLGCSNCRFPGSLICWLLRSWQPLPRGPLSSAPTLGTSSAELTPGTACLFSGSTVQRTLALHALKSYNPGFSPIPDSL